MGGHTLDACPGWSTLPLAEVVGRVALGMKQAMEVGIFPMVEHAGNVMVHSFMGSGPCEVESGVYQFVLHNVVGGGDSFSGHVVGGEAWGGRSVLAVAKGLVVSLIDVDGSVPLENGPAIGDAKHQLEMIFLNFTRDHFHGTLFEGEKLRDSFHSLDDIFNHCLQQSRKLRTWWSAHPVNIVDLTRQDGHIDNVDRAILDGEVATITTGLVHGVQAAGDHLPRVEGRDGGPPSAAVSIGLSGGESMAATAPGPSPLCSPAAEGPPAKRSRVFKKLSYGHSFLSVSQSSLAGCVLQPSPSPSPASPVGPVAAVLQRDSSNSGDTPVVSQGVPHLRVASPHVPVLEVVLSQCASNSELAGGTTHDPLVDPVLGPVPSLPQHGWSRQPTVPRVVQDAVTAHLDAFLGANGDLTKEEVVLAYILSLPASVNNSQLLQAEVAYLFFTEEQCPLLYDIEEDIWWVYDSFWRASAGNLTRVKAMFQQRLLPVMRQVLATARGREALPPHADGSEHCRLQFVAKTVVALESRESAEKIIKEASSFMEKEAIFDEDPDLFQLQNCVLHLPTNTFRRGRPTDMCRRASPVTVPEALLDNMAASDTVTGPLREAAWRVMWSMFCRVGPHHPDDNAEELGDQDKANFDFLMAIHARLLEGRPTGKMPVFFSNRGRNSKGINEKIFISLWGDYYVPVKSTVFMTDRRNENEHSAAELNRRGARVLFFNEVQSTPWSNAVFKNKNSSDPVSRLVL